MNPEPDTPATLDAGAGRGAPERPSLLNPRGSGPLIDRAMPIASGAVAWGLVGLVVALVGYLLVEGGRHIDGEFLTEGVSRGAYFRGGTIVEVTLERAHPTTSLSSESPLLSFRVDSAPGDVALRTDVSFEADAQNPSARWRTAGGSVGQSLLGGAAVDVAGGSVRLEAPFVRASGGESHDVALIASRLPAEVTSFTLRFLVQLPLRIEGVWPIPPRGGASLEAAAAPLTIHEESGWVAAADHPIRLTRIARSGVWPMIVGTVMVTLLMTVVCVPFGVLAAVYLHEYARRNSLLTRVIRGAINNLAGVPSIVFGLFGLGFFIAFCGQSIDRVLYGGEHVYGQPCVLWASFTLAVLTLPVVIVSTEEALRSVPDGLRMGSLALGATHWQTVWRIAVPQAFPGILTGMILAVSRGAGEVAPILFTGATNFRVGLPSALGNEKFMHLGYHVYALATQSPDVERTRPLLFATVAVLLALTFLLNVAAVILRARAAAH